LRLRRATVARNAGLSRRELAKFERGRRDLSVDEVRSLAGSLGVDVGELLPADELRACPAPSEIRIEDVLEVPDDLECLDSLPPADPLPQLVGDVQPVERRKVPRARVDLDDCFSHVRSELDEVIKAADRLRAMGIDDDPRALVFDLQRTLGSLRENRQLEVALLRLAAARDAYRDTVEEHADASWRSRRSEP
jgi:transcriptional regulator with XRE-family HTH domain